MTSNNSNKMVHIYPNSAYDENPPKKMEANQWREDWDDEDVND